VLFLNATKIANAKIEGLVAGINMPSNGYNVCLSVFYILFVLAEIPFNFLQEENKFKPAYLLGAQMFCFGMPKSERSITMHELRLTASQESLVSTKIS
jgi:hypothetical protein